LGCDGGRLGAVEDAGCGQREQPTAGDNHQRCDKDCPEAPRHGYQNALTAADEYTVSHGIPFLSASMRSGMP